MVSQFNDFMTSTNDSALVLSIALLVAVPTVTLIHELGHGLAALALTRRGVAMTIGPWDGAQPNVRVGRLSSQLWCLLLRPLPPSPDTTPGA